MHRMTLPHRRRPGCAWGRPLPQHLHPVPLQPGRGGVELGEGRDEDDRPVAPTGEQHAVGVDTELEGVAHVRRARMALGAGVGPGAGSACGAGALLPHEVGPPRQQHAVELQPLGAELGDALAQVAAGAMALLAVAVPGPRRIGYTPLLQDLVPGRGDEAVARVGGFGVAGVEVVLGRVEVAGHGQVVAGGLEARGQLVATCRRPESASWLEVSACATIGGSREVAAMKRDDALRILAAHREEFATMGVRELAIFGSVARDEASDGSDIDVLVDYEPGTRLSYFRVFYLQERLEELLGAKVDLVTMGGLRSELRDGILAEAIHAA